MSKEMKLDFRYLRRAFTDKNKKTWFEFTRTPCFVCGKSGFCLINEDGKTVACTRIQSDVLFSKKNNSYIHQLEDGVKVDTSKMAKSYSNREKAYDYMLDTCYRNFLKSLTLQENHAEHLKVERKLSVETILARQYVSYPKDTKRGAVALLGKLAELDQFKEKKFEWGFPGLYLNNGEWDLVNHDGILIPYRNRHNEILGFQVRVTEVTNKVSADPRKFEGLYVRVKEQPNLVQVLEFGEVIKEFRMELGQKVKVTHGEKETIIKLEKGQRYVWLSSSNKENGTPASTLESPLPVHVAVPTNDLLKNNDLVQQESDTHLVNIETDAAWITEGALKADIAIDHIAEAYADELGTVGKVMLAVPGVNTWRTLIPILEAMKTKRINIAFDMDAMSNEQVRVQYVEMVKYFVEKGYKVYAALWSPEVAKGVDDALQLGVKPKLQKIG